MKRTFVAICAALMVTGCVQEAPVALFAYKPNTTNAQKSRDSISCEVEATRRVPANNQFATTPIYQAPTYVGPVTTSCFGNTCSTSGAQVSGGQIFGGQAYSYDANAGLREEVKTQCMIDKGYQIFASRLCQPSQVPQGLSASTSDQIIRPATKFCIAPVASRVGVPIPIN